jgi:hypothetical protein
MQKIEVVQEDKERLLLKKNPTLTLCFAHPKKKKKKKTQPTNHRTEEFPVAESFLK